MRNALWSGLIAFGCSLVLGRPALAVLRRARVLDHPSERSSHVASVPRGGGVAPGVAALATLAVAPSVPGSLRWPLAVSSAAFGLIGLAEDIVGIRPIRRLALQFGTAALIAPLLLTGEPGSSGWGAVAGLLVIFWVVSFVNAFNFMDGIDGISVAQSTATGLAWVMVGTFAPTPILSVGGAIVAAAALGFAPYNVPRARMFLGDVGSYFLGAWLAAVAVLGLRAGVPPEAVFAPLLVYLVDTGITLVRRVLRGDRWYLPHREHTYQRLRDHGWSHARVSAFTGGCVAACGVLGLASLGDAPLVRLTADLAIAVVVGAYLTAPSWQARGRRRVAIA